jgi:hemoglobin-like flavoprotein
MIAIEQVKKSFDRCSAKGGDIIQTFYDIFLVSHPEIKPLFANTYFESQKKLLLQGLDLTIMFASDAPVGKIGINRIKKSHCKFGLNIPPHLYPYWKESFLQAISKLDPEFSEELKLQWDWVLQKSIDFIIGGYEGDDVY